MIVGYHIIFSTYGFWLPNDPRGSWSDFVGSWEIYWYGAATKTNETRSLAHQPRDRALRVAAKTAMKYAPVRFNGLQARAVGRGFARYLEKSKVTVWACSIMPDHIHLVTATLKMPVERLVVQLKGHATRQLLDEGLHPHANATDTIRPPKCFVRGQWKVYLEADDVERAIRYVENNPIKEGKRKQTWSFLSPFQP